MFSGIIFSKKQFNLFLFSEELQIMSNTSIHTAMLALEEGVHDIWVSEDMVTLGEAYTYLFNQEKLKSIESAKILVGDWLPHSDRFVLENGHERTKN